MYLTALLEANRCYSVAMGISTKQQLIALQHRRFHHLGSGAAHCHLLEIDVAAVGKIQGFTHSSTTSSAYRASKCSIRDSARFSVLPPSSGQG